MSVGIFISNEECDKITIQSLTESIETINNVTNWDNEERAIEAEDMKSALKAVLKYYMTDSEYKEARIAEL